MNFRKLFGLPRNQLRQDELEQARGIHRLVNDEKFKLLVIQGDSARFNNKELKRDQEVLVDLLENRYSEFMGQLLGKLGFPNGTSLQIDLSTGKVSKGVKRDAEPELPKGD